MKMNWYYWICHHGPGHQSVSDGFFKSKGEDVEDRIESIGGQWDWPIFQYWQIEKLPKKELEKRIIRAKEQAKAFRSLVKELEAEEFVGEVSEEGKDEEIMTAFGMTVDTSVIKRLHERDILIDKNTLCRWRGGIEKPIKSIRKKALEAIKGAEKYKRGK
jgi:hypothetical protein